jgi:hypothetical protein
MTLSIFPVTHSKNYNGMAFKNKGRREDLFAPVECAAFLKGTISSTVEGLSSPPERLSD